MELKKLSTMQELRTELDSAPQLKLRIASAIADILMKYDMRATGTLLGSLNLVTVDEMEKLGIKAAHVRASHWTI